MKMKMRFVLGPEIEKSEYKFFFTKDILCKVTFCRMVVLFSLQQLQDLIEFLEAQK